ncbi:ABC transporter ATP-binding protein [Microbacterium oryzae]|uniref:ABC transporter ATP-binding protein n=1 Tax=Microbacterium oryzae TaxID=743009 RepID=A0A6I6DUG7_9MICO|nr:ABC transporter ATP-binding protein [Microbacterium oryzae]QGU28612.1 ABC transporter ATP-binding protein [Microbacterium oryzae]
MSITHTSTAAGPDLHAGGTSAISLSRLVRRFDSGDSPVVAVDGVDLRIARGEIVALLGPNGAGKTTTIDMMLGLSEPNEGEVRVLGEAPRLAVATGRLSAVLQTGGLLADLTVRETVAVVAGIHGARDRVDAVIERADLAGIARRRVSKCSGGEQQRLKFALAVLPDPDVLVLDEPTAGMDVTARRRFWDAMREDAAAGRTIVFATHYLEEAEQFARRTIVMSRGRIVADEDTARLRASLGGRTVSATLPGASESVVACLREDASVSDLSLSGGRLTARTSASDALAARLLSLGASDLEIAAPTLEDAFTSLTEDRS